MIKLILASSGSFLIFGLMFWLIHQERRKNRFSPFTENMLRSPGHTLDLDLQSLIDKMALALLVIGILPLIYFQYLLDANISKQIVYVPFFIVVMSFAIYNIIKLFRSAQNVRLGLFGEVYTGQELNYLMHQGAWVYHDIPYKYGNIDHIVISKAGVFVVETKAVRKPATDSGGRKAKLIVTKDAIKFPHMTTSHPIDQVQRHKMHLKNKLSEKLGFSCPVFSVVSLPGWFVEKENQNAKNGFLVINPKRGKGLEKYINEKQRINESELKRVVSEIENFARSVEARSNMTDPDANKNYSFFLNRKHEEAKL